MRKSTIGVVGAVAIVIVGILFYFSIERSVMLSGIDAILDQHYKAYKKDEYFSGISLSVYQPGEPIKNYHAGTVSQDSRSKAVDDKTLFEIGSITKSFTAAIILQLEKDNKLKISDTLGQWLPQYGKWSQVTIEKLLNMTSGLPNYSDAPLWNAAAYQDPKRIWTDADLIKFVYPVSSFNPPLKTGYYYTNTSYALSSMIVEKITKKPFNHEITKRLIKPLHLDNTFYPVPVLDAKAVSRLAAGYGYNPFANPELVGKDVGAHNLSWAGAAGAIVANSEDVVRWVKALFTEDTVLDAHQKAELMQIVSNKTGMPIKETSVNDRSGFGLGVSQGFDEAIGHYWYYEGQTEGYRALYMYVPANGVIIAALFNSAVDGTNDHASLLVKNVYEYLLKNNRKQQK